MNCSTLLLGYVDLSLLSPVHTWHFETSFVEEKNRKICLKMSIFNDIKFFPEFLNSEKILLIQKPRKLVVFAIISSKIKCFTCIKMDPAHNKEKQLYVIRNFVLFPTRAIIIFLLFTGACLMLSLNHSLCVCCH